MPIWDKAALSVERDSRIMKRAEIQEITDVEIKARARILTNTWEDRVLAVHREEVLVQR